MKTYLTTFSVVLLGFVIVVAAINYRVDPRAVYRFSAMDEDRVGGLEQFFFLRVSKPWQVVRLRPAAIVVGTSRSATLRPSHPAWSNADGYNLSIPGMTVYELRRFIEHAQNSGRLDKLMIGLDFEAFTAEEPAARFTFEEARMLRTPADRFTPRFALQFLQDAYYTLFTLPILTSSVSAYAGAGDGRMRYLPDGTWATIPAGAPTRQRFLDAGKAMTRNPAVHYGMESNIADFASILRIAHRQGIETRLFVTPVHVFMLDLGWRMGHRDSWYDFHRRLVETNAAVAAEFGTDAFPLLGFNHLAGIVDEPIGTDGNVQLVFLPDGIHPSYEFGDLIMSSAWSEGGGEGFRLDQDSVEDYLHRVWRLRNRFETRHREMTSELRRAISPRRFTPAAPAETAAD